METSIDTLADKKRPNVSKTENLHMNVSESNLNKWQQQIQRQTARDRRRSQNANRRSENK